MKSFLNRRRFLQSSLLAGAACSLAAPNWLGQSKLIAQSNASSKMNFGLVTYLWGKDWELPALIANCEASGVLGVELRTTHAHGVEPSLNKRRREEVRKRFQDSGVRWVGIGSNERYDHPDPEDLDKALAATREFIKLGHDIGGTGVKVKPNQFHEGVPREKTIEQIGKALNQLAAFADGYGQQIRLEVHGQCAPLPIIKQIMDVADHPNAAVCWNSNDEDLNGEGLEYNFNLVKDRFGATAHVRELNIGDYPYPDLIRLFVKMNYDGWVLLEARTNPAKPVEALIEQRKLFEGMAAKAKAKIRA